ncbi:hypothetical protein CAOG_009837 [Capsaspora owczarzaki ATCC 30864]|uniref:Fanconi Anaemia group E protein C-terminal domain-containing protein n=3 Tax=Capsaspora owczarzaki (strain ATCC 30864) TaxID=595528 RepID=A0A0D2X3P7_CAPO3|nr:hypothetical protein CAOG_009837 [Capsaspora owczarzaki ATCC 30864]
MERAGAVIMLRAVPHLDVPPPWAALLDSMALHPQPLSTALRIMFSTPDPEQAAWPYDWLALLRWALLPCWIQIPASTNPGPAKHTSDYHNDGSVIIVKTCQFSRLPRAYQHALLQLIQTMRDRLPDAATELLQQLQPSIDSSLMDATTLELLRTFTQIDSANAREQREAPPVPMQVDFAAIDEEIAGTPTKPTVVGSITDTNDHPSTPRKVPGTQAMVQEPALAQTESIAAKPSDQPSTPFHSRQPPTQGSASLHTPSTPHIPSSQAAQFVAIQALRVELEEANYEALSEDAIGQITQLLLTSSPPQVLKLTQTLALNQLQDGALVPLCEAIGSVDLAISSASTLVDSLFVARARQLGGAAPRPLFHCITQFSKLSAKALVVGLFVPLCATPSQPLGTHQAALLIRIIREALPPEHASTVFSSVTSALSLVWNDHVLEVLTAATNSRCGLDADAVEHALVSLLPAAHSLANSLKLASFLQALIVKHANLAASSNIALRLHRLLDLNTSFLATAARKALVRLQESAR